ncbi:hypothetical protein EYF80_066526 [Liparis tanakae]|uniref:Uncharacterized protein n=1 Tax=Liparis tanakae TaxID=230148 RepID=A0A4Z2E3K8_9TELE|nr:hypothetical protein EYF80_066526 [Liparis tanakae]
MSVGPGHHDDGTTQGGHAVQQDGGRLSTTQLVLRRGLVVFGAVSLLAAGATIHFLLPSPQTRSSEANFTLGWSNMTYTHQILSTALVPNK